jgi:hypothetical protein
MERRSKPVEKVPSFLRRPGVERVFVGSLVNLFRELGMNSTATYHNRKHELVSMQCIRKVWNSGFHGSGWALLRPPTYDLWVRHVGKDFRPRDAEVWDAHEQVLENFLGTAPSLYPDLLRAAARSGARTRDDFIAFLAKLPEPQLRSLHPLCLGFAIPGTVHTCMVAPLDPLAPTTAAGAWKRRRDHLAQLKLQESPSR